MKTAIVIGAGPAGLTAAYELRRRSNEWKIIVLEESAEIGGISRTVVHEGCRIDIGGHRFFMPPNESDTAVGFRPVLAREIR